MSRGAQDRARRVCLGAFAGAHGVKGAAKIKTFTAHAEDVAAYGPLTSEDGRRRFTLKIVQRLKDDLVLATAPEITSREDAIALAGVRLYIDRAALPPTADEDEFYLEDLVGLEARDAAGARIGAVTGVHDFGAGDIIEVARDAKGALYLPFTRAAVPTIDVAGGFVVVVEPALEAPPGETGADAANPSADGAFIDEAMRQSDA